MLILVIETICHGQLHPRPEVLAIFGEPRRMVELNVESPFEARKLAPQGEASTFVTNKKTLNIGAMR
jgi:hypothetical protein